MALDYTQCYGNSNYTRALLGERRLECSATQFGDSATRPPEDGPRSKVVRPVYQLPKVEHLQHAWCFVPVGVKAHQQPWSQGLCTTKQNVPLCIKSGALSCTSN